MQIKRLADELEVSVSAIKRVLKEGRFFRSDRTFKGAEMSLTHEEALAVRRAHHDGRLRRERTATREVEAAEAVPDPEVSGADLSDLPIAATSDAHRAPRGEVAFPIHLHEDVLRWSSDPSTPVELRKVFTRRVQELMAHGVATRTKGTRGKNAGWLRTPLGGKGGNQFYLWLCNAGEPVRERAHESRALYESAAPGARFLRDVRHHDATKDALDVGDPADYCLLQAERVASTAGDGLVSPLMSGQRSVVDDPSPVRVIVGRPGAGKTTSLLATTSRLSGRALYVTWSSALAERARQWLDAYAPADLEVEVATYHTFLSQVDPTRSSSKELSLPDAVAELRRIVEPVLSKGPWRQRGELRAEELYAELHAYLVGWALPVTMDGRRASVAPVLSDADYRATRHGLGEDALTDALRALRKLDPGDVKRLFAGPTEAFERARALQTGELELGPRFAFDWILVDEVQDLTLVEQWLLIDVAARSGRARGVVPGLVFAGDEAQTVRPTAFEFAPLRKLVTRRLGRRASSREHALLENLRSPETIARFVDVTDSTLYGLLPRRERPRGHRSESPGDVTVGRVAEVEVRDDDDVRRVFESFKELAGDAAVVYPGTIAPSHLVRLADEVGVTLWTSETIKGLEFRSVGVLAVPDTIQRIAELAASTKHAALATELARSTIDRLLVASSRSTETLVLCGKDWTTDCPPLRTILATPENSASSEDREGFLGRITLDDLTDLLELDAVDALPRIEALLGSSARFLEIGLFADALREAENARGLLGTAGRPGSAGKHLRVRTHRQLALALTATGLAEGRSAALRDASRAFHAAAEKEAGAFLTALAGALHKEAEDTDTCQRLHDVALGLDEFVRAHPDLAALLKEHLRRRIEDVVEGGAVPRQPSGRSALVQALDVLSRTAPSDRDVHRRNHQRALTTMLRTIAPRTDKAHRSEFAELRRHLVDRDEGIVLDAAHAEANGDLRAARNLWEEAKRGEDALRCARMIPDFDASARVAALIGAPDDQVLAWARDVVSLLEARPSTGSLTEAEREALTDLARAAWTTG